MTNWDKLRAQFPATQRGTYLNSASTGLISESVAREGRRFYDGLLRGDHTSENWWPSALQKIDEVRQKVAKLIGADKSEIAFVPNTSHGMSLIAEILDGNRRVVTMADEFPSSTLPWINRRFDVHFVDPENGIYPVTSLNKKLMGSDILVTSHVQFATGFKQNLVELGKVCESRNTLYVVNATQSVGAVPVYVKEAKVDFLVFSGVKWMCAGKGVGAIYINKKLHNRFRWPMVGWMSTNNPMGDVENFSAVGKDLNLKNSASVLEAGAPLLPNIFVLGRAVDLISSVGIVNIDNRIRELTELLIGELQELGVAFVSSTDEEQIKKQEKFNKFVSPFEKKHRSGIVVVGTKNPVKPIVNYLRKKNIIVSEWRGGLRISVHMYNNEADIERFVSELKKLIY